MRGYILYSKTKIIKKFEKNKNIVYYISCGSILLSGGLMSIDNLITVVMTDEDVKKIDEALGVINEVIKDKVVSITPKERRKYASIGDKNRVLLEKCKLYMDLNPRIIPPTLDMEEFKRDYKAREQLDDIYKKISFILEKLLDTKILLDHDNYTAMMSIYNYVKYLSSQNEPGISTIFADLKKAFQHQKSIEADNEDSNKDKQDTNEHNKELDETNDK